MKTLLLLSVWTAILLVAGFCSCTSLPTVTTPGLVTTIHIPGDGDITIGIPPITVNPSPAPSPAK